MRFVVFRILGLALFFGGMASVFLINHSPPSHPEIPNWFAYSLAFVGLYMNSAGEVKQLRLVHKDKRSYLSQKSKIICGLLSTAIFLGALWFIRFK